MVWTGAVLIEREGAYEVTARALDVEGRTENDEHEDEPRHRWRITLKRGGKTWIVVSHHWPGEENRGASSLPLHEGAYELKVEFAEPAPTFFDEDDLFPLRTGLQLKYAGPDTDGHLSDIPYSRMFFTRKDGPLGAGIAGLSPGASAYLSNLYVSSLRDIRRTYQRAFKAHLAVHRAALSAHPRAGGKSELGYMLAHKDRFAGTSYYPSAGGYIKHNAEFDFNLLPLEDNYYPPVGDARTNPSPQRMQALFDWWERLFDYDRVRRDVRERSDRHLWLLFEEAFDKQPVHPEFLLRHMGADLRHWRIDLEYFQGQTSPVYQVSSDDLQDDRWMVRAWRADKWIRALLCAFTAKDITEARPDLWASDDPSAELPGQLVTGNANLSQFLCDGLLENGLPRRYEDLERLNDGLRERGRRALLNYLCGPSGIAKHPRELSDLLLLDVEAGIRELASRIDEAISAAQTFIQRSRLNLEPGWKVRKAFALLWDRKFATYRIWEACKRRELYKENWIDWCEIEKAKKVEAFRFLDEELRRATLAIARPGGVDYWPDERPPRHPSLTLLQERQPSEMQLLHAPREGLDLLGAEERAGRPTWLTNVPGSVQAPPPPPPPNPTGIFAASAATSGASSGGTMPKLPFWMESAIAMGTTFLRVAASGYPPASTEFRPRPEHKEGDGECCVDCCVECGKVHPRHMDEYYFWLVDGYYYRETTQDEHYDQNLQSAVPWHDKTQLKSLLEWPSTPVVRLAWCRVHNGEFDEPRRSEVGIPLPAPPGAAPDLTFAGRVGDSLYFGVTNAVDPTPGFRYDLASDSAVSTDNLVLPAAPLVAYPGGLFAYPFFAYLAPGARLFPWSLYAPATALGHALRPHCRFEAALRWYALVYDPLDKDNTWMRCKKDAPPPPPQPPRNPNQPPPGAAAAVTNIPVETPAPVAIVVPPAEQGSMCCDTTDISCAVARHRSLLLHYLDTLLEWSDAVMRRNSIEGFQQARVILDAAVQDHGPAAAFGTCWPVAGKANGRDLQADVPQPQPAPDDALRSRERPTGPDSRLDQHAPASPWRT